ncbi:recombinase family protein [Wukongibacter baidiensis]|uniref:recombinase family protein n=1 Tax=Wukongibacter baidiensis TaxID=1723361 RepID=UPI003D7FC3F1
MKKAAIYARVSSKEQAEEGVSIPAQLKQLKEYAINNGYEISYEFVDRGESARSADRPEFQSMIAMAKLKPRPFNVILIHKTDRFARNREDSIVYKSLLRRECGVEVISITENFDDSPTGKMMEGIMEVVAEFYSANLAKEVMKGMEEKASEGGALGEPPYGYYIDTDSSKFRIYEPESKVVRYIYRQYINGSSLRAIGVDLRQNGLMMFGEAALTKKSKAVKGRGKYQDRKLKWQPNSVRRTLSNISYLGDYVWNGHLIKNNHPKIISRENFEMVQDLLSKRRTRRKQSQDYLLRGLVRCYECGGGLSQFNQRHELSTGEVKTYTYLRCSNHVRLKVCYPNLSKMKNIEAEFMGFFKNIIENKIDFASLNIKQANNENILDDYNRLKMKYNGIASQFDRQMEAFQAGVIDLKQLQRYKDMLKGEKERLKGDLDVLRKKIDSTEYNHSYFLKKLTNVSAIIENVSIPLVNKKNALNSVIDEIRVSSEESIMEVTFKLNLH